MYIYSSHDPYAGNDDAGKNAPDDDKAGLEKAQQVMKVARQQNLTDGASRDKFAQKLYLGLKQKKQKRRRQGLDDAEEALRLQQEEMKRIMEQESSESEEEFVEVEKV